MTNAIPATDRFGVADKAYSFDGATAYVAFASQFILHQQTSATVSFWSYHESGNGQRTIFWTRSDETDNNRFHIYYDCTAVGDTLGFNYRESNATLHVSMRTKLSRGVWVHTCIVRSGNNYTIFTNGTSVAQSLDNSPSLPTTTGWRLAGKNAYGFRFRGKLDDIRFYNRALSQSEIQQLYHENGW